VSVRPKLVVGLGNPGREYAGTRHNVGFEVLDRLAEKRGGSFKRRWRLAAEVAEVALPALSGTEMARANDRGVEQGGRIILAKPRTFMNRSGTAVVALVHWLKIAPAELLVVVDDADLRGGELRLRARGGAGGHNGLRSIIGALGGNEEFARLRVGIGGGGIGAEITGHVLSRFNAAERVLMDETVARAVAAVECCWKNGLTAAMNQFNRRPA